MAAIRAIALSCAFGATRAVDALSLEVREGEIFGLVGPDGAGKTTTMRMLTGILPPDSGSAVVAGLDVVAQAELLKSKIGYMSQRFGLYPDLTVEENIRFYADIYGVAPRAVSARMEQLLAASQMSAFKRRFAGNLSGGMKQKLGLACALIHTPSVLFLDEPTNGVDPVSRRDFWRLLYQLVRDGVTIFVSTAYLDEAERCNRLALLHEGRLLGVGTPDEIKGFMRGALLELRTPAPRRAAAALRDQLPEATVGLFGDQLHIALADPTAGARRIRAALAGVGLEITSLRQIEPSLEDVFVAALAARGAIAGAEERA